MNLGVYVLPLATVTTRSRSAPWYVAVCRKRISLGWLCSGPSPPRLLLYGVATPSRDVSDEAVHESSMLISSVTPQPTNGCEGGGRRGSGEGKGGVGD